MVHGRNLEARDCMCTFLRSIALHPITFDEVVLQAGRVFPYIGEILTYPTSSGSRSSLLLTSAFGGM